MEDYKVYIVVLNYNTWSDSLECLESLLKQSYLLYEIIVVDNCSTNDSRYKMLGWAEKRATDNNETGSVDYTVTEYRNNEFVFLRKAIKSSLHFLWSDKNGGYAYGNNIGILYSKLLSDSHFIWILNNDTVVMPESLTKLIGCFNKNIELNVGLVGCIQTYYDQPQKVQCLFGIFNKVWGITKEQGVGIDISTCELYRGKKIDYLYGASLFTHSEVINQVGFLSEEYFLYFEELDFAERLQRKGLTLAFCFETYILHKQGSSTGDGGKKMISTTPFSDYHTFRSKFIFGRKFYKSFLPFYLFISCLQIINRLLKGRFKNVIAVIKGITKGLK